MCFSRYDPKTNQWSSDVAPTSTCRTSVGVAVLGGYLYAVGGQDGVSCLNIVERYFFIKKINKMWGTGRRGSLRRCRWAGEEVSTAPFMGIFIWRGQSSCLFEDVSASLNFWYLSFCQIWSQRKQMDSCGFHEHQALGSCSGCARGLPLCSGRLWWDFSSQYWYVLCCHSL